MDDLNRTTDGLGRRYPFCKFFPERRWWRSLSLRAVPSVIPSELIDEGLRRAEEALVECLWQASAISIRLNQSSSWKMCNL